MKHLVAQKTVELENTVTVVLWKLIKEHRIIPESYHVEIGRTSTSYGTRISQGEIIFQTVVLESLRR